MDYAPSLSQPACPAIVKACRWACACPGSHCRAQASLCCPLLQTWLHLERFLLPVSIPVVSASSTSSLTLLLSPALKIAAWTGSLSPLLPTCPAFLSAALLPSVVGQGVLCSMAVQGLVNKWAMLGRWIVFIFSPVKSSLAWSRAFCIRSSCSNTAAHPLPPPQMPLYLLLLTET